MMIDYIMRLDALIDVCIGCNEEFPNEPCEPNDCKIKRALSGIPTADVVEVVRCKDCKYATYDKSIDRYNCRNWGLYGDENTEADDFCSYGEKKVTGKLEREQTHEIQ